MKKINLKNLSMDEVLTRSELKKIMGGDGSWPDDCWDWRCSCPGQGTWVVTTCSAMEVEQMMDAISNSCPWGGSCM